ncbi:hypothetical protein PBI_ANDREW_54 [Arthrobacter phage Andrew]|uniref:Uncharacterized protein n=1 Tax=Arthrobacter phage Andrew TaxID=2419946 RepID=A0A3G2KCY5_9CAUD|nr:hypothetical protein HOU53_gp54 [Arthrobacter phage Andrew]AYN56868.1 hypothetical protein PBI_ANDREW_54 [Arthrobacter phage Andrew]
MSGMDEAPRGLQPGPMVVEDDTVALVLFRLEDTSTPDRLALTAEIRARLVEPEMVVRSLRMLADKLEGDNGGPCPGCGGSH